MAVTFALERAICAGVRRRGDPVTAALPASGRYVATERMPEDDGVSEKPRYHQILWRFLREVRILQLHEAGEQSPTTGGYAWAKDTRETAAHQGARRDQE